MSESILKEIFLNRKRILKISFYNLYFQYNQTKLKLLWTILNPILQAGTYWLVFFVGMKNNSPVEGVSYINWMLTGLVPWFYISTVLSTGLNGILSSAGIIKNMKYSVSIIPLCTVITELIAHICFMAVLIGIHLFTGISYGLNTVFSLYYCFAITFFLIAYAYLMSTVTVFLRDIQKVMSAIIRLLFFFTPICWFAKDSKFEIFEKWNPFAFIIEGYRETLLYNRLSVFYSNQHIYFWILSLIMMICGCILHKKLKKQFVDYI